MSVEFDDGDPRTRSLTPKDPSPFNGTVALQAGVLADPFPEPRIATFLNVLVEAIEREADTTTGTRARLSADADLYRIPPLALVFPASIDDVLAALDLAREYEIPVAGRDGGTSCAGDAIEPGIILGFAHHLGKVMSIDPQARTAIIEPGCIKASLQEAAVPFGLRFGPDPSG